MTGYALRDVHFRQGARQPKGLMGHVLDELNRLSDDVVKVVRLKLFYNIFFNFEKYMGDPLMLCDFLVFQYI